MPNDDQVDPQTLRYERNLVDGIAESQMASRGKTARAQPPDTLVQHILDVLLMLTDRHFRRHFDHTPGITRRDRQQVRFRATLLREFSALNERPASLAAGIVESC